MTKHKAESQVAEALLHNKNLPERKKRLTKLRLKGDYHFNMTTLETGEGELIVVRRLGKGEFCTISDFLPCEYCLGSMKKWDLWKHPQSCEFKTGSECDRSGKQCVQQKAKLILAPATTGTNNVSLDRVLCSMKCDSISDIVKRDQLIKAFGLMLLEKNGLKNSQFLSQKMSELGRLVESIMAIEENKNVELSNFLWPEKFDTIVKAVRNVAGFSGENGQLKVGIPSLALKVGYSPQKCASILTGQALRSQDESALKDSKNFQRLMKSEWEYTVSHHSLTALHERKFNKVNVPPLADDIANHRNYVDKKIEEESMSLEQSLTTKTWTSLARLLLARIVMLNKRRGGEASMFLLVSYQNRPEWIQCSSGEILASLNSLERRLSER